MPRNPLNLENGPSGRRSKRGGHFFGNARRRPAGDLLVFVFAIRGVFARGKRGRFCLRGARTAAFSAIVRRMESASLVNNADARKQTMGRPAPAFGAGDGRGISVHVQFLENRPAIITFVAIERHSSPLIRVVGSPATRLLIILAGRRGAVKGLLHLMPAG